MGLMIFIILWIAQVGFFKSIILAVIISLLAGLAD